MGWGLREFMPEALVREARTQALTVCRHAAGLVVHSDQGRQDTATRLRTVLAQNGAVHSMSRRGNCYNNTRAEALWHRLKTELLDESIQLRAA